MTAPSAPPRAPGVAAGIADANRVGINAKAQAANPISKSRFILVSPPLNSRYRHKQETRNFWELSEFHQDAGGYRPPRQLLPWRQPSLGHGAFDDVPLNPFALWTRNVRRSWANPLGSIAVNFIGEPQAVHCGPWFCVSSMCCS
jgi:hypothetical protein